MRRLKLYIFVSMLVIILSAFSACGGGNNTYPAGEEFTLHIGETASIKGQELQIKFLEISEDSRCPKNVTCIWEGRVTAVIEITRDDSTRQIDLTEPGLGDAPAKVNFEGFEFVYRILPYPEEAGVEISQDEYRLMLKVNIE